MIPAPYVAYFEQAIHAYPNVPPSILYGVITQESHWNPNPSTGVPGGGLGQITPQTAQMLGVTNRLDPGQNIMGTARYLSQLLQQFGGSVIHAVAAYNTGPANVLEQGLAGVLSPTWARGETSRYVSAVNGYAQQYDGSTVLGHEGGTPTQVSSSPISCLPLAGAGTAMVLLGAFTTLCR